LCICTEQRAGDAGLRRVTESAISVTHAMAQEFLHTFRSPLRRRAAMALAASLLVCGCGQPPDDSPAQQMGERLVGTWLRDYEEQGFRIRRVLVLQPDGHFREAVNISESGASVAQPAHAGDWVFDGTNLKRRYTRMNGQQPSAPTVPFATFELRFESPNEFVGIDNVHRREVRYRRVAEGTEP
jgi:hypothetical protein